MRIVSFIALLILTWTLLGPESHSQPQDDAREEYLHQMGTSEINTGVEQELTGILNRYAGFLPTSRKVQLANFFSFILTINGYSGDQLNTLNQEGLNIGHAITADNRPLVEQSLLADFVIKGKVLSEDWTVDQAGNQIREINILVEETYKGLSDTETIIIRQRNGREYGENPAEAAPLEQDRTYLLLLNNGLFRYAIFRNTGDFGESQSPAYNNLYSIYRHYEMDDKRVLWNGYNSRKTKKALKEIKWLDSFSD